MIGMKLSLSSLLITLLTVLRMAHADDCQRLQEFDQIVLEVNRSFFDQTFRGLDWPARVASYRREVDCSASEQALSALSNRLLSELGASHTGVFTARDLEYWAFQSIFSFRMDRFEVPFSGIWPLRRDGKWFANVIDDGVRSGKELLASIIRTERLGTLVGSTTAGAFLAGTGLRLLDDRYFLLLAVRDPQPRVPIEGIGVAPHVVVAPCREYCGGADPQLEKVFELIRISG